MGSISTDPADNGILNINHNLNHNQFQFINKMYTPVDPENSMGATNYFVENIMESVNSSNDKQYILELINEISIILNYSNIVCY